MKSRLNKLFPGLCVLFLCSVFLLDSCSGGGGGGGSSKTAAKLSSSNAGQAASGVSQASGFIVGSSQTMPNPVLAKSSGTVVNQTPVIAVIDKAIAVASSRTGSTQLNKSMPVDQTCPDGGSMTGTASWSGLDTDPTNLVMDVSFNSCKMGTQDFSGGMHIAFGGPLSSPSSMTISTANLAYSDTSTGDSVTMNMSMDVTDLNISSTELVGGTITVNGTASGTYGGDPLNAGYDNFVAIFSQISGTVTVSISGSIYLACLSGWVDVATITPISGPVGSCPTAGEITIIAGSDTVRMVVATDTSITVYLNNVLVETYTSCTEIGGLCSI